LADSKPEETFKVIDRRLFTEEGELRKEAVDLEKREEEAAAKKAAKESKAAGQAKASGNEPAPAKAPAPEATPQAAGTAAEPEGEQSPSSRSFQLLVDFLTRNAAAMLGGMADPRTGQAFVDLEGAREVIDMLDALREKTRGNLSKADDELLIEVLGSLKLTFMEVSRAATEAMAKKMAQKK